MPEPRRATITIAEVDSSKDNRVGIKTSDGTWHACWDKKLWPRLTTGANLNVELTSRESNGRTYENITGILGTAPNSHGTVNDSDKDRRIVREVALKAACEIAAFVVTDGPAIESILTCADRFVRWIEQAEEEAPF